ncbi:hypothetical protein CTAYLR_004788 [Chrysophaeum taylorii]|uniref:TRAF-type domain-containing protein n=1 Tax=Chrysophaeum taylorii TaxID=2483200 RepID=A0AAD7UMR0_9STRA|nr:hypothetical protein CTAYLR_004788 [Chrysophaeum taylorii]
MAMATEAVQSNLATTLAGWLKHAPRVCVLEEFRKAAKDLEGIFQSVGGDEGFSVVLHARKRRRLKEAFSDEQKKLHICGVCDNVLDNPCVAMGGSGESRCFECLRGTACAKNGYHCAVLDQLRQQVELPCRYEGCAKRVSYDQFERHDAECAFASRCVGATAGCAFKGTPAEVAEHEQHCKDAAIAPACSKLAAACVAHQAALASTVARKIDADRASLDEAVRALLDEFIPQAFRLKEQHQSLAKKSKHQQAQIDILRDALAASTAAACAQRDQVTKERDFARQERDHFKYELKLLKEREMNSNPSLGS